MVRETMQFWVIQCPLLNLDRLIQMLWDAEFQSTMCGCVIVGLFLFGRFLDSILAFSYLLLHKNCLYHLVPFVSSLLHNSVRHCPPVPPVHGNLVGGCHGGFPSRTWFRWWWRISKQIWMALCQGQARTPSVGPPVFVLPFNVLKQRICYVFLRCKASVTAVCVCVIPHGWSHGIYNREVSVFVGRTFPEHNWRNLNEPESKGYIFIVNTLRFMSVLSVLGSIDGMW